MKRKKKLYSRPRKLYQTARIKEENELVKKYALKNKREVWKTLAELEYYRHRAQDLATKPREEQEKLFSKLQALGLKVTTIADVLGLNVEDFLKRRLPTIVAAKKLAQTPQHARQLVTHKKVFINGKVVNAPGYFVRVHEENLITTNAKPHVQKVAHAQKTEESETEGDEE